VGGRGRWKRPLALPITLGIHHANQKPFVGWCRRLGVPEEAQVPRRLNELQDGKGEEGTGREGTAARACYSSKPLPIFCNCSNSCAVKTLSRKLYTTHGQRWAHAAANATASCSLPAVLLTSSKIEDHGLPLSF
jgi:hypothetical protein